MTKAGFDAKSGERPERERREALGRTADNLARGDNCIGSLNM